MTRHDEECIENCPFEDSGEKCRIMHSCERCSSERTQLDLPGNIKTLDEAYIAGEIAGQDKAIALIEEHIASLTDANETEMYSKPAALEDLANFALRTCRCGLRIDGFYEYADHLKEILTP